MCRKCKAELFFDMEMENRKDLNFSNEEIDCSVLFLTESLVSLECPPFKRC